LAGAIADRSFVSGLCGGLVSKALFIGTPGDWTSCSALLRSAAASIAVTRHLRYKS
jgi:hypothetical protein